MKPPLYLIKSSGVAVLEQLRLEEALLRCDDRNWLLLNTGSPPAIVMGISGAFDEVVDAERWQKNPLPVIRRFSGGGSVVVDENTLFVTLICQAEVVPVRPYPGELLAWMAQQYRPLLSLKEHDFVIDDKKCGGNALYLQKGRWLVHSTFLWDYRPDLMACLQMPSRQPAYRRQRKHGDFLCRLHDKLAERESLYALLMENLSRHFNLVASSYEDTRHIVSMPHRSTVEASGVR